MDADVDPNDLYLNTDPEYVDGGDTLVPDQFSAAIIFNPPPAPYLDTPVVGEPPVGAVPPMGAAPEGTPPPVVQVEATNPSVVRVPVLPSTGLPCLVAGQCCFSEPGKQCKDPRNMMVPKYHKVIQCFLHHTDLKFPVDNKILLCLGQAMESWHQVLCARV